MTIGVTVQMSLNFKSEMDQIKKEFEIKKQQNQLKAKIKTIDSDYRKHFSYLATLLHFNSPAQLENKLDLLYRASEHNFDSQKFHELCDGKGPTLVIIRSTTKRLFGGYSSKSWFSYGGYVFAPGSFLFSLDKQTKHEIIYGKREFSIFGRNDKGPTFGHEHEFDLSLENQSNRQQSRTQLGITYSHYPYLNDPNHLTGSSYFMVEEYEVFGLNY